MNSTANSKEFYYAVLNLPTSASDGEIRERYRALSVLFHPDKQRDERTKETAAKKFLDIQKAYEVLSDPFLRVVYDVLGEDGLTKEWSDEWRSRPPDQVRRDLKRLRIDFEEEALDKILHSSGRVTCGIDASSLFDEDPELVGLKGFIERLRYVDISTLSVRYSVQKAISEKTRLTFGNRVGRTISPDGTLLVSGNIFGTVRHQFSPRLEFEVTSSLLRIGTTARATYKGDNSTVVIEAPLLPHLLRASIPPLSIALSHRLSRGEPLEGTISFSTGLLPQFSVELSSPSFFDFTPSSSFLPEEPEDEFGRAIFDTLNPFARGVSYRSCSVTMAGPLTRLKAELGARFIDLSLHVKFGIDLALDGLSFLLGGIWEPSQGNEIGASVGLDWRGVVLKLELAYVGQRFSVPIALSTQYNARLALLTAVMPSTAFAVFYYFVLKSKRQVNMKSILGQARKKACEENSDVRREYEAMQLVLKDAAKRHMQAEANTEGLVILEATYGPGEITEETADLTIDVTVPLQALVHNSQLYIPSHRSKASLPGFYDPFPFPFLTKVLRIRYLFGGRTHYAEIPDNKPVVLPLEDHLVE